MTTKLRSIQVLRAVAVCAVVLHHTYGDHHHWKLGAAGVDLFFVISGFIMVTIGSGQRPMSFLAGRAWRIYPMWWAAVAFWLLIMPHAWQEIATSVSLWPIYGGAYYMPALGPGWSLCFEMLFYCAFAIALATRSALPIAAFAACFVMSAFTGKVIFQYLGSPLICDFLLGVVIARLPHKFGWTLPLGALWLVLAPSTYFMSFIGTEAIPRVLWWGLPCALIVYGALSLEPLFSRKWMNLPVLLGDASYSIYLFHMLAIRALPVAWFFQLLAGIGLGLAIHILLERRLQRMKPRHYGVMTTIPV